MFFSSWASSHTILKWRKGSNMNDMDIDTNYDIAHCVLKLQRFY